MTALPVAAQRAYARRDALREAAEKVRALPTGQVTPEAVADMLDALAEEQITG